MALAFCSRRGNKLTGSGFGRKRKAETAQNGRPFNYPGARLSIKQGTDTRNGCARASKSDYPVGLLQVGKDQRMPGREINIRATEGLSGT